MQTDTEIKTEIETLVEMKPRVRHSSGFGDDHHAAIDAQIEVLGERMSEDAVWDRFGDEDADEYAENVRDAALEAHRWMRGEDDQDAPSEEWMQLLIG